MNHTTWPSCTGEYPKVGPCSLNLGVVRHFHFLFSVLGLHFLWLLPTGYIRRIMQGLQTIGQDSWQGPEDRNPSGRPAGSEDPL